MKKLERSDVIKFSTSGNEDPEKIKKVQRELLTKVPQTEEHPTVLYVLEILNSVIQFNVEIDKFAKEKNAALLNPMSKALSKLNEKIETTVVATMLAVDIEDSIIINNEESEHAAEAMRDLLAIHDSGFPDNGIKDKHKAVIEKLATYKIERDKITQERKRIEAIKAREEAGANPNTLSNYLNDQFKQITTTKDVNSSVEELTELMEYCRNTMNSLNVASDQQSILLNLLSEKNNELENQKKFLATITLSNDQCTEILNKFDVLSADFSKKIAELESRRDSAGERDKINHTQAVDDANTLVFELKKVRDTFEKNKNIDTFTRSTSELFNTYQQKDSFKINRSNPWFRTFISKPFELLKAFINQITVFLYGLIHGRSSETNKYRGTLFNPPETDTSKKLNEFDEGVKHLCNYSATPTVTGA